MLCLVSVQPTLLGLPRQLLPDAVDSLGGHAWDVVVDPNLMAGDCSHLGDAGPHRAGPDDSDGCIEVKRCHELSLPHRGGPCRGNLRAGPSVRRHPSGESCISCILVTQ